MLGALLLLIIPINSQETMIASYIRSLIRNFSANDPSKTHDVAVIQLDDTFQRAVYDDILTELLKKNTNNPVYAHSSKKSIPPYAVHASSFYVIILDNSNLVSNWNLF